MAIIEKRLAEALVDLRAQQALGTEYVHIDEAIDALQTHLEREQWWRGQVAQIAAADAQVPA